MKIKFLGGVETVTGSCYLVETSRFKILIDCGLFQGDSFLEERNFELIDINPDFIFLTHAHLDHIGRLPYFYKHFLRNQKKPKIFSTEPTKELAQIILQDSAKILKEKSEILGREPIYDLQDLNILFENWHVFPYKNKISLPFGEATFFDAGHILGSSFILFNIENKKIVFSGDLGNNYCQLLNQPDSLPAADFLVLESTYGGRIHEDEKTRLEKLEDVVEEIVKNKGVLLIPIFAIEKSQEIIYDLYHLITNFKVPPLSIFLDSPLAFLAFRIYKNYFHYLSPQARPFFDKINYIFNQRFVIPVLNSADSYELWKIPNPKIILAGSGMSNGGRIVRHEKKYLSEPTTILLLVGFQAQGSLGRKILDGASEVEIEGEKVKVRAKIETIFSYSLHADQKQLLDWIFPQRLKIQKIFLVHGEPEEKEKLRSLIVDNLAIEALMPRENEIFEL